jgi:hypothetical protein
LLTSFILDSGQKHLDIYTAVSLLSMLRKKCLSLDELEIVLWSSTGPFWLCPKEVLCCEPAATSFIRTQNQSHKTTHAWSYTHSQVCTNIFCPESTKELCFLNSCLSASFEIQICPLKNYNRNIDSFSVLKLKYQVFKKNKMVKL